MNAPKKTRQGPRKGIQASSFCLRLRMWIEIISKISISCLNGMVNGCFINAKIKVSQQRGKRS